MWAMLVTQQYGLTLHTYYMAVSTWLMKIIHTYKSIATI